MEVLIRYMEKITKFLVTVFLVSCLAACSSSYAPTGPGGDEPVVDPWANDSYNVSGQFVTYQAPANPSTGSATIAKGSANYQGQAISLNLLYNGDFTSDGQTGSYVGNWASNTWGNKVDFTIASPGDDPPSPKCLYMPTLVNSGMATQPNNLEVIQYVPVEAGAYYYFSAWCYSTGGSSGSLTYLEVVNDFTGSPILCQMNGNSSNYMGQSQKNTWVKQAYIFQVPPEVSNFTNIPFLRVRLRQNNATSPDMCYTKVRIYKLDPASVGEISGAFGPAPGSWDDLKLLNSVRVMQPDTGGTISANPVRAKQGGTITLSATPASSDWVLKGYQVTDVNGNDVPVSNGTFTMPDANVNVIAAFQSSQSQAADWYNVSGYYVPFTPDLELDPTIPPSGSNTPPTSVTLTGTTLPSTPTYQGQASTMNKLYNPDFDSDGQPVGAYTGNWVSNLWNGKTDFTTDSPSWLNAPALKCLYMPPPTDGINLMEVMQRVPVESNQWYYVSVWYYRNANASANMLDFTVYGDATGPFTEAYTQVGVNLGAFNSTAKAGEWNHISLILQIPDLSGIATATDPQLEMKFKQNLMTAIPIYYTKAEIFKLFPGTVENYTGTYGALPGPITDPMAP